MISLQFIFKGLRCDDLDFLRGLIRPLFDATILFVLISTKLKVSPKILKSELLSISKLVDFGGFGLPTVPQSIVSTMVLTFILKTIFNSLSKPSLFSNLIFLIIGYLKFVWIKASSISIKTCPLSNVFLPVKAICNFI